jgi:hypothetical protein
VRATEFKDRRSASYSWVAFWSFEPVRRSSAPLPAQAPSVPTFLRRTGFLVAYARNEQERGGQPASPLSSICGVIRFGT